MDTMGAPFIASISTKVRTMKLLNRSALVVRPREPFLRWAGGVFADGPEDADELRDTISIYLVSQDPDEEQESAALEDFFAEIFENELLSWCTDEARWPKPRDFALFQAWFDVTAQSIVHDLAPGPVQAEMF